MSENENSDNNIFAITGIIAVVLVLLGFFTFSSQNTTDVVNNTSNASDKTIPVEEIVVIGEPANNAEAENEAAINDQVNEAIKNSEDTDLLNAE